MVGLALCHIDQILQYQSKFAHSYFETHSNKFHCMKNYNLNSFFLLIKIYDLIFKKFSFYFKKIVLTTRI
jgi:hypothetical protein